MARRSLRASASAAAWAAEEEDEDEDEDEDEEEEGGASASGTCSRLKRKKCVMTCWGEWGGGEVKVPKVERVEKGAMGEDRVGGRRTRRERRARGRGGAPRRP